MLLSIFELSAFCQKLSVVYRKVVIQVVLCDFPIARILIEDDAAIDAFNKYIGALFQHFIDFIQIQDGFVASVDVAKQLDQRCRLVCLEKFVQIFDCKFYGVVIRHFVSLSMRFQSPIHCSSHACHDREMTRIGHGGK